VTTTDDVLAGILARAKNAGPTVTLTQEELVVVLQASNDRIVALEAEVADQLRAFQRADSARMDAEAKLEQALDRATRQMKRADAAEAEVQRLRDDRDYPAYLSVVQRADAAEAENERLRAHVVALGKIANHDYPELSDAYKRDPRVGPSWVSYKLGYDAAKRAMRDALAEEDRT
jgi:hypothetical protein